MEIKAVLFDLDGTLLPMDQDEFVRRYYQLLAIKLGPVGYEPKKLIDSLFVGVKAMIKNDGRKSNEEAFWEVFTNIHGEESVKDKPLIEEFYDNCAAIHKSLKGRLKKPSAPLPTPTWR